MKQKLMKDSATITPSSSDPANQYLHKIVDDDESNKISINCLFPSLYLALEWKALLPTKKQIHRTL